jgi:signal transduction histidine kinase
MESADCSGGFRNMAITSDGKLWVATPQGVAMLDVPRLPHADKKIATYIEKIVIGKTPVPVGRELIVKPGTRHVELHFDAIEVSSPEKIRLQYRLDDVDREWLDATATASAIYTGFPIGTHKFHVRASNRDGVWDRAGIVYNITQQPYFYQTGWFAGACVMALIGILGISHRFRLQYVTSRIQERLEERASERVRIARELHDTLLQSFHGLLLRFQAAHNLLPGRVVDARQVLEAAIDNAAQAITEARDAVQDLRSSTIVTNDLAKAIEVLGGELRAHQRAADGDSTDFSVHVEGTPIDFNPILRDEIYRIAGEALRNAFHHARARRIEVEIRYAKRHFSVRVRDDGIGIDASVLSQEGRPGHFGLRGMRERSKSIGGQLEVWSEHGAGTEMELTIPATIAYGNRVARRLRLFKSKVGANS